MQSLRDEDGARLGERHQPSGLNSRFIGEGLPFAEYVRHTCEMLKQAHAWRDEPERGKRISGNAPFELHPVGDFQKGRDKPYRRGVLLTHGLSDSPYHIYHLASCFQRNGFRVMAVLLPGNGTQPGDLLDVPWQEWEKSLAYGAECMTAEADELYLAGFSAGAALSVLHGSHDKRVRGLFLFSPAFEITSRAAWAHLHKLYSWLMPKAAWVTVRPDRDFYKYESLCMNAVAQMYALTQALPRREIDIPVFAVASADDSAVHASATLRFMQRAKHPCNRLVWYATEKIEQPGIEWVNSALPSQRILSSAHTAIVMPPEDPHYGVKGDYANCLHYLSRDPMNYAACLAGSKEMWLGEINKQNLRKGLLRRLMFNPHFAAMETSLQKFIGSLP